MKSSLCDYSDAFILVTGDITVTADNDTYFSFKNCAPFSASKTEINDAFIDESNHIYTAIPMYNLIEYRYIGSLWPFKRDETRANDADLGVVKISII